MDDIYSMKPKKYAAMNQWLCHLEEEHHGNRSQIQFIVKMWESKESNSLIIKLQDSLFFLLVLAHEKINTNYEFIKRRNA